MSKWRKLALNGRIAFIGTSAPPPAIADAAREVARMALSAGLDLVSGGSWGVDHIAEEVALELGCPERVLLVLPWRDFGPPHAAAHPALVYDPNKHTEWRESVSRYHPRPDALSPAAWKLHARNYGIITASGVKLCVALTRDRTGGTWQGIRIAEGLGVPLAICRGTQRAELDPIRTLIDLAAWRKRP